jgi:anti-anti-sigma regulatory factor
MQMKTRVEHSACGNVAVVTLMGALDAMETFGFRRALLEASRTSTVTVLDLRHLHRVDRGLVNALNSAAFRVQHRSHRIIAVNTVPHVAAVLRDHASLIEVLPVEQTPLSEMRPGPRLVRPARGGQAATGRAGAAGAVEADGAGLSPSSP